MTCLGSIPPAAAATDLAGGGQATGAAASAAGATRTGSAPTRKRKAKAVPVAACQCDLWEWTKPVGYTKSKCSVCEGTFTRTQWRLRPRGRAHARVAHAHCLLDHVADPAACHNWDQIPWEDQAAVMQQFEAARVQVMAAPSDPIDDITHRSCPSRTHSLHGTP